MQSNVGGTDRTVRIVLGLVLLPLSYLVLSGILSAAGYVVGGIALITGLIRFCPVNAMLGIDTCTRREGML